MVREAVEEINSFIFAVTCEEGVKEGFFEDFLGVSDGLGVVLCCACGDSGHSFTLGMERGGLESLWSACSGDAVKAD